MPKGKPSHRLLGKHYASANPIPCAKSGLPIPMFRVEVKDPIIGWQVVGVAHELNKADAIYDNWTQGYTSIPAKIMEADQGVPDCWAVVRRYDGLEVSNG